MIEKAQAASRSSCTATSRLIQTERRAAGGGVSAPQEAGQDIVGRLSERILLIPRRVRGGGARVAQDGAHAVAAVINCWWCGWKLACRLEAYITIRSAAYGVAFANAARTPSRKREVDS